ncbi:hypothetical protein [Yersinia enterocolitica]|uniref:hypothetical protein n=1 Tax=Yersinia enterocolitica TaxID=630 RepID=UPI003CFDA8A7
MNVKMLKDFFKGSDFADGIIAVSETDDNLGSVLRVHLLSEMFLEAFICSSVGNKELFDPKPLDKVRFNLTYSNKLKLALKLGLPTPIFKAMDTLNDLRNGFAHNLGQSEIKDSYLESMISHINKIEGTGDLPLSEQGAQFFNKDGTVRARYFLESDETPNRVKLLILYAALVRRAYTTFTKA